MYTILSSNFAPQHQPPVVALLTITIIIERSSEGKRAVRKKQRPEE